MFDNTTSVWDYIRPRLRGGPWWRTEVVHPDGFPDVMGFFYKQVHFVEIKANGDTMRPAQVIFGLDCLSHSIDWHVIAARGERLAWFRDVKLLVEVKPPPFFTDR